MEYAVHVTIHVRATGCNDADDFVENAIQSLPWASDDGTDLGIVGYSVAYAITEES